MSLSLLDYHSLEDGELNRLWYEENDPRARDAFRTRWWLGGDPIAGKDLLSEYHNLMLHRCFERGVLAEEHQLEVFRRAVGQLVSEFPADPIPKFEDFFLPFVDRAIDATSLPKPPERSAADDRARIESALGELGEDGTKLRGWAEGGDAPGEEESERLLAAAKRLLAAIDDEEIASQHPLVRTEEPPPSKLDESVAVPHFKAAPLFAYAANGGHLTKREDEHVEWCQPCRQRCVGALLLLRRMRRAFGGDVPPLPNLAPQFDQILQEENPEIPSVDPTKGAQESGGSNMKGLVVTLVVVGLLIAALVVAAKMKS